MTEEYTIEFKSFKDKLPKKVEWLWKGFIPRGVVGILFGRPDAGKSTIAVDIAATITQGRAWPLTGEKAERAKVLIAEVEDDEDSTINGRLRAAGADLDMIRYFGWVTKGPNQEPFSITKNLDALERELRNDPEIKLVILSPISDFLDGVDQYKAHELRRALRPLVSLAKRTGVTFLGIAHPRKQAGKDGAHIQDAVAGSQAWVAVARVVMLATDDVKNPNGPRYFGLVKCNLCTERMTLSYQLVGAPIVTEDGSVDSFPKVIWAKDLVPKQMADIFTELSTVETDTETLSAREWLEDYMADGLPHFADDIYKAAKKEGFKSESTIRKAKMHLPITVRREGFGPEGRSIWVLNIKSAPELHGVNSHTTKIHTMEVPAEGSKALHGVNDHTVPFPTMEAPVVTNEVPHTVNVTTVPVHTMDEVEAEEWEEV